MSEEIMKMSLKEATKFVKENPEYEIDGEEKCMPIRMLYLIQWVSSTDIVKRLIDSKDQQDCYNIIREIPGYAHFLSYQIFVDLTYIPEFKFSENDFTISGPGCTLGISMMFDDQDGMSPEECLFWVRDNLERIWTERGLEYNPEQLFDHLPEHDRLYNVMMLENSYCELSKMTKAKRKTGRPRMKYTGLGDPKKNISSELF